MPPVFQKIALHCEDPDLAGFAEGSRDWRLLNVLHVASYFASVCLAQEPHRRKMVSRLMLLATRLGVETDMLTEFGDKVVQEWYEWSKLFGIHSAEVPRFSELLEAVPLAPEMLNVEALRSKVVTPYSLRILLVDDDRSAMLMMLQTPAGSGRAYGGHGS